MYPALLRNPFVMKGYSPDIPLSVLGLVEFPRL